MAESIEELLRENAFHVLGLGPDCSWMEAEREGARWLSALELKLAGADRYLTPLGPEVRTPERVRRALAQVRDPQQRLLHEWIARLPPAEEGATPLEDTPFGLSLSKAQSAWHLSPAGLRTGSAGASTGSARTGEVSARAEVGSAETGEGVARTGVSWPDARAVFGFGRRARR